MTLKHKVEVEPKFRQN